MAKKTYYRYDKDTGELDFYFGDDFQETPSAGIPLQAAQKFYKNRNLQNFDYQSRDTSGVSNQEVADRSYYGIQRYRPNNKQSGRYSSYRDEDSGSTTTTRRKQQERDTTTKLSEFADWAKQLRQSKDINTREASKKSTEYRDYLEKNKRNIDSATLAQAKRLLDFADKEISVREQKGLDERRSGTPVNGNRSYKGVNQYTSESDLIKNVQQQSNIMEQERERQRQKEQEEYDAKTDEYRRLSLDRDFDRASQYRPSRTNDLFTNDNERRSMHGYSDPLYEYVNQNQEAQKVIDEYGDNSFLRSVVGTDNTFLKQMNDDEIRTFNYIDSTQGRDAATEYLEHIKPQLSERQREYKTQHAQELAEEHPIISSVATVATSPYRASSYVGQLADLVKDGTIDQNASYNQMSYLPTAIRQKVGENFGEVGSFLYQTGMSMADFLYSSALLGGSEPLMLGVMGSGAAADKVIEAKDEGLDDGQAFALGTIAGAAEFITEKISVDALLDDIPKLGKNFAGYFVKNFLAEGTEEVASDLINTVADVAISKDKSAWSKAIQEYMNQGYTEQEAFARAMADQAKQMGLSFLGGAISGAGLAAGVGGINIANAVTEQLNSSTVNYDDTLAEGATRSQISEAQTEVARKKEALKKAMDESNDVDTAFKQGIENYTEAQDLTTDSTADEVVRETAEPASIRLSEKNADMDESEASVIPAEETPAKSQSQLDWEASVDAMSTMGENGKEALKQLGSVMDANDLADAQSEFTLGYEAGRSARGRNALPRQSFLTEIGYRAGVNDGVSASTERIAAAREAVSPTVQNKLAAYAPTQAGIANTAEELQAYKEVYNPATGQPRLTNEHINKWNTAAKLLGVRVRFTDHLEQNAYIDDNGEVVVAMDADIDNTMDFYLGHEFTHRLQQASPQHYNALVSAVRSSMSPEAWAQAVSDYQSLAKKHGVELSESGAVDEIVADHIGKLLDKDGTALDDFIRQHVGTREGRTLIQKVRDFIRSISRKLHGNDMSKRYSEVEKRLSEALQASYEKVQRTLDERQTAREQMRGGAEISTETKAKLEDLGAVATDNLVVKNSLRSWKQTDIKALKAALKEAGFNAKEIDEWISNVNGVAATILADRTRLDYEADEHQNALKSNSEYYYTLDLSTLCKKRQLYQGTYNAIMHRLKNEVLFPEDTISLRKMMADMGYEVPCGICYEESRKKNEGKFAKRWLNGYGKRWKGYKNMPHTDPYIPKPEDVTTTDGRAWLRKNHPEALESYLNYQKTRGSANPKVSMTHTDYRGDIMRFTDNDIKNVKHIGGLRIQSFSDFETVHVIDMMQAVMDMSAKKLTAQAYTKVPAFADIFGGTGIKINLSLIGEVDENGNLQFDSKEGMNPKEAFRLRDKYSENVGTILVGANDASILAAWADPRIDMVIPFHRSGWSKAEFERLGLGNYKDFTKGQTERYMMGKKDMALSTASKALGLTGNEKLEPIYAEDYWVDNRSGKENAEAYLKLCAEKHYRPVFYQFLQDNGDGTWSLKEDGSTDGYWKSLIDFKMYDNNGKGAPQQTVKPNFDMDAAQKTMDSFDGDPNTLPVAQDVVDKFVKEFKKSNKQYSFRQTDDEYMDAVNRGDMETAQRMVDEAAKAAGYSSPLLYHGTDADFNQFKPNEFLSEKNGESKIKGYFSEDEDYAKNYGDRVRTFYVKLTNPLDYGDTSWQKTLPEWKKWFKKKGVTDIKWDSSIGNDTLKGADFDGKKYYSVFELFDIQAWWGGDGNLTERIEAAGYDGMKWDYDEKAWIPFLAENIKSADPVTYDENGNVIPLSERFNERNEDVRYSIRKDSEGRELTEGQREYFKNSKAVDKDGNLLALYHGTANAGFTTFRPGLIWMTTSRRDADSYGGNWEQKLFNPNERDKVTDVTTGNFTLEKTNSYLKDFHFDSQEDLDEFIQQHPNIGKVADEDTLDEMLWDDEISDDEYDELVRAERDIRRDYNKYNLKHSTTMTIGDILDNPERFDKWSLEQALYAYDSNADVEPGDTAENLREVIKEIAERDTEEEGEDWLKDFRSLQFKARIPVGESGQYIDRANNRTYALYANVTNPLIVNANGQNIAQGYYRYVDNAVNGDYDGVIIRNVRVGAYKDVGDVVIAFSPEQVKSVTNQTPTENEDIRFSFRGSENILDHAETVADTAALQKQIESLQRKVKNLEGEFKHNKGFKANENQANKVAKYLLKSYGVKEDIGLTGGKLAELANQIMRDPYSVWIDLNSKWGREVTKIANRLVLNSENLVSTREATDFINNLTIYIDPSVRPDIDKDVIKQYAGKLNLTYESKKGKPIKEVYKEISKRFKWLLPDNIENAADQFEAILSAYDIVQNISSNLYSEYTADTIQMAENDIWNQILGIAGVKNPDSYRDKMEKRLARIAQERDEKLARVEQHYRDVKNKAQLRKQTSEVRKELIKVARRLEGMKTTGVNRAVIREVLGNFDTISMSITGKSLKNLSKLRNWVVWKQENDPDFILDPEIERKINRLEQIQQQIEEDGTEETGKTLEEVIEKGKGWKQVPSLDMAMDMLNILKNLEHVLRTEKQTIDTEDRRDAFMQGLESTEAINNSYGNNSAFAEFFDKYLFTEAARPSTEMLRICGYNENVPLYQRFLDLTKGQRDMADYARRANVTYFDKFINDKEFIREVTGKHAREIEITGIDKDGKPITVKVTPDLLMSMYMHSMNDQNALHVKDGGMRVPNVKLYKDGKIAKAYEKGAIVKMEKSSMRNVAMSNLTQKELAFIHSAQNYYKNMSQPELNATSEKLVGYEIAKVDNYYRIVTDKNWMRTNLDEMKIDGTIEGMGFTKERINASNPIQLIGMISQVTTDIKMHSKYVGLAIPIRNFNQVYGTTAKAFDKDGNIKSNFASAVRDSIERKWGKKANDYIIKMIGDIQNPKRSTDTAFGPVFGKLRSNYAKAVLTLNASVAIKQAASYPTAAAELGWKSLAQALATFPKTKGKSADFIAQYSPLMRLRQEGYISQETGDILTAGKNLPKAVNWIQMVDIGTVRLLWLASEYSVRETNPELKYGTKEFYEKVGEVHTRVIENTQPNYTELQRAQILRSDNDLVKMLNMFKTQPLQNFNILMEAFGNNRAKSIAYKNNPTDDNLRKLKMARRKLGRAISSQLVASFVFAGMSMIWDLFRGKRDKYEDEEGALNWFSWGKSMGLSMISNLGGMLPFGSTIVEGLESASDKLAQKFGADAFFGQKFYGLDAGMSVEAVNNIITDGSDFLAALVSLWRSIRNSAENGSKIDWGSFGRDAKDVASGLGQATGIPVDNLWNTSMAMIGNSIKITDGYFIGKYEQLRIDKGITDFTKKDFYKILQQAYYTDTAQYTKLYDIMIKEDGFATDSKTSEEVIKEKMQSLIERQDRLAHGISDEIWEEYDKRVERSDKGQALTSKKAIYEAVKDMDISEEQKQFIFSTKLHDYSTSIDAYAKEWAKENDKESARTEVGITDDLFEEIKEKRKEIGKGSTKQEYFKDTVDAMGLTMDQAEVLWKQWYPTTADKKTYAEYLQEPKK